MNKHTPEPWVAVRNTAYWEIGTEIGGYYAARIGDVCATDPNHPDAGKQEANAARIVACVNACAGMDDPAAEITRLRARLAAWKAEAEAWRQADDCDPMVRGECIREARERRAATDAIEKNAS